MDYLARRYYDVLVDSNKAREEMLQEIDEVLMSSTYWQGGRLDTIKWLVEELNRRDTTKKC